MPLEPRHPYELDLHHELRDALNEQVLSASFFVWIDVRPTGDGRRFAHLDEIVRAVADWLGDLDPDAHRVSQRLAERWIEDPAAEIKLRAIPKNPDARGNPGVPIVGNPEPILVGWTE
jgi:hypothetical protein